MSTAVQQIRMPDGPNCAGCAAQPYGVRFVPPSGTGSSGIMAVSDSPWVDEIRLGAPFMGAAGAMLDRLLRRIGTDRSALFLTNAQHCKPKHLGFNDQPERYPDAAASIEQCRGYLDDEIARMRPRCFFLMGNVAMRRVAGVSGVEQRHSYIMPTPYGIPAVASFHPSYLMQGNHKLSPVFMFAMRRAEEIAAGTVEMTKYNLMLDPSADELRSYIAQFPRDLGEVEVDIETPESAHLDEDEVEEKGESWTVVRAGFSIEPGTAVTFPFEYPYTEIMRDVLSRTGLFIEWADNHFDSRRLRAAGMPVPIRIASGMWAWHLLQSDLLKGLGFVAPFYYVGSPWKHLNDAQPAYYNAMDNAVTRTIWEGVRRDLGAQGRWHVFERHCIEMETILIPASQTGIKIDRTMQQALKERLIDEYAAKLDELHQRVPDSVRSVHPKGGYKKPLREGTPPPSTVVDKSDDLPDAIRAVLLHHARLVERDFSVVGSAVPDMRQYWLRPFNPSGSAPDTKNLIRSLGLKVPINRKKGDNAETTEAKHLKRFAKKYPIFRTVLDCRERQKVIGTYIWALDENDMVHSVIGFHPSTWRKSSRSPNLQNVPKRNDLAKAFRRMIVTEYAEDREQAVQTC